MVEVGGGGSGSCPSPQGPVRLLYFPRISVLGLRCRHSQRVTVRCVPIVWAKGLLPARTMDSLFASCRRGGPRKPFLTFFLSSFFVSSLSFSTSDGIGCVRFCSWDVPEGIPRWARAGSVGWVGSVVGLVVGPNDIRPERDGARKRLGPKEMRPEIGFERDLDPKENGPEGY